VVLSLVPLRVGLLLALLSAGASRASSTSVPPTGSATAPSARVIVVVGHNGGAPDLRPPLRYADDDAARLYLQLAPGSARAFLLTTFDAESARLYPDLVDVARPPTTTSLAGALGEAFWHLREEKDRGKSTELVFAFAGHGDVDDSGRGFVVLSDGPFFRHDLQTQVVRGSPADLNHILVDACASYYFVKSRGGSDDGVALTPQLLDVLTADAQAAPSAADQARTGVLVSTSSAQETHESAALSAGVFSYLLRSALAGAGDINGDGRVEYAEAAAFVASASQGLDDPRARLRVHAEAPLQRPHAPLLSLKDSGAKSFLAVEPGRPTRLRLKDSRGLPLVEVHSDGAKPVYIALSGQPFFLVERGDEEAILVPRSAGAFALSALSFAKAPTARGDDSRGAFAPLFARPFSRAFVDGYLLQAELPPLHANTSADVAFAPEWAVSFAPKSAIPIGVVGGVFAGGAGLVGAGAAVAVVMNQLAFSTLEQGFLQTGQLDPAQSLEVEGWRNAATGLTVGAVGLALLGGSLIAWSFSLEDGALVLP
jgi:hypothetical protein